MYSQNNEEEVILRLFNGATTPGSFLDIGAYDGKTLSNTYRLVELGWGGVCVEPSPNVFTALLALHANNPKISLVNSAIGLNRELLEFYDSMGDAVSSLDLAHKAKWEAGSGVKFKKFYLLTITLEDLFTKFGTGFEFLNLDVENTNLQLFLALPLERFHSLKVICVEHDGHIGQIVNKAAPFGFKQMAQNGENLILAR